MLYEELIMGKKRERTKKSSNPRGWKAPYAQVMRWTDDLGNALRTQNFQLARQLAQKILRHVPASSAPGKDALGHLGTALAMLHEYEASYETFSEALATQPERSDLWYNRALSARFTTRTGQSLRDLEKAVALEHNEKLLAMFTETLEFTRGIIAQELALRGPDFTVDQLIEQQLHFTQGITLTQQRRYAEAELAFKHTIAMGDVLPQPWANLAGCYMLQERYAEAETALKRALEVDPDYEMAQENLKKMPYIRQHGIAAMKTLIKPAFADEKIRHGHILIE